VDTSTHFCPNPDCAYQGWVGWGNLRAIGHPTSRPWRQLLCIVCRGDFLETLGTIFHGKRVAPELSVRVSACLAEGLGMRGTARVFEVDPVRLKFSAVSTPLKSLRFVVDWAMHRCHCLQILRRHHMGPAPQRQKAGMGWTQFLKLHWEVLAATDFFTVEVVTWHGLVTYYVLVVLELATRRVLIAGITPHPTAAFMQQCARQLTEPFEGFLVGKRYLLHDRDTKFTHAFDALLKDSGVEPIVLPPRSPNLNAHCERFVRSIKEEALAQMIMLGEHALSYAIQQYLAHYHHERNHQGLANQLIIPAPDLGSHSSQIHNQWF
jgi:transposase InsO family protein